MSLVHALAIIALTYICNFLMSNDLDCFSLQY